MHNLWTHRFFLLIFLESHAECGSFPAPTTFLIRRRGASALFIFRVVPPALNLFVVRKSKVANQARKSEEFRQTFGWTERIIAVDRKTGRHDLSMAHNVRDGLDRYEEHIGLEPVGFS